MATQLQIRRGTNSQVAAFTGAEGEIVVNTTNDSVHVNDGSTAGGFEMARADLNNVSDTSLNAALTGNTVSALTITTLTLGSTAITATGAELNYVDGVTSAIQTQLNAKAPTANPTFTGSFTSPGIDDNADAIAITIDSSENVGIGVSNPSDYYAENLVVAAADEGGITIKSASTHHAYLMFADGTTGDQAYRGYLGHDHATDSTSLVSFGTIGLSSVNETKFTTNNTERMRIDASGNVGIGTSSPSRLVHLLGTTNPALRLDNSTNSVDIGIATSAGALLNGSATNDLVIARNGAYNIKFGTNGSTRATIESSGNVGIGTSSPSSLGTGITTLELKGNSASQTDRTGGIRFTRYDGTHGMSIYNADGASYIESRSTYPLLITTNGSERIRIPSNGGLDITNGSVSVSGDNYVYSYSGGSIGHVRSGIKLEGSTNTLEFYTSQLERMRIDSSGNLLVGRTSASVGTDGFQVATNGTTYSSISSSNTYHVYNTTSPGYTFYVGFTGGVINYQANNVNLSDEREKKNIEPLESKWDSVKSWSLKTFHYKHQADESIKNYGVIAQDVEKTNPEAINAYKKDENTERKGVKEQQMMWMAIKALQEAQTRIETLEERLTALENN